MQRFAALFQALDASTGTGDKVAALRAYFQAAPPADAAWAVYFLAGGKPRQVVPTALLREIACRRAGIDDWLFDECYQAVGDLAETIANVLPPGRPGMSVGTADGMSAGMLAGMSAGESAGASASASASESAGLSVWIEQRLLPLRGLAPEEQSERVAAAFDELDAPGRFLLVKLIGGGFRVGVSKLLVQRALAAVAGLDAKLMAQRLVGWTEARATPSAARYTALLAPADAGGETPAGGQPYPFFLAHPLQADPATLGDPADWLVEWKYDGMRAQVVKRAGQVWIWSRGEELVTERFPEVVALAARWPDGSVVDGELLAWLPGSEAPASFHLLQQRLNRKTLPKKLLAEAPVALLAYDLLEEAGTDLRAQPQAARRARLEDFGAQQHLRISPAVVAADWPAYAALRLSARERGVEGFMLKQRGALYGSGRTKSQGTWWKWKVDPLTVDAVLVYAQAGHGRRASVYTDYTFAVWNRTPADAAEAQAVLDAIAARQPVPANPANPADRAALQLLPFAKAYSGLTDEEFAAVDRVIRATTVDKFGPVRSVKPSLVFEIGFEGIQHSPRHKSGVAVRFPRMLRVRHDKPLHEADTLAVLHALMAGAAAA